MGHTQKATLKQSLEINTEFKPVIDEVFSLLSTTFPLSFIGYLRFFPDGKAMAFSNNLKWQKFFLQAFEGNSSGFKKATLSASLQKHTYIYLWPDLPHDKTLKALNSHNIWNGMSLYQTKKNYIDSWSFAGTIENDNLKDLFINHTSIFERFISYVENKYNFLFQEEKNAKFQFSALVPKYSNPQEKHQDVIQEFMSKSPIFRKRFGKDGQEILLTPREMQIIERLPQDLTAKKIARSLGIHHRTVETYLNNLRQKFDCSSKTELLNFV